MTITNKIITTLLIGLLAIIAVALVVAAFGINDTNRELRQQNLEQCMASAGVDRTTTDIQRLIEARDRCGATEG